MKYELFMICPPWRQYRTYKRYQQVLTDSIPARMWRALRAFNFMESCLAELASKEHVIVVWVTDKFTEECREYLAGLGYQYDTFLLWKRAKWKRGDTKAVFEYLMVFQKDGYKVPATDFPAPLKAPFLGKVKFRGQKPDDAYAMIEALYPTRSKVQIFGTCHRPGWDIFQRNDT
ncbi:hypothetical protein CKK33_18815 [Mucilaginibacter sp. MD40]|uniref:MT-A70 family methyltransferase n=1 Tax=Mucilaginibacter sp. MD40 TaxID=2029590 RepID=UPI000BAC85F2|nr:MT-A70 family methyltransferase [Mucilaginibacter sp. MD40]PAW95440.1 hypothetical protein CKK33_18815 [Mucilaginibacter sp. MD40]